jgi:Zn-finger protein
MGRTKDPPELTRDITCSVCFCPQLRSGLYSAAHWSATIQYVKQMRRFITVHSRLVDVVFSALMLINEAASGAILFVDFRATRAVLETRDVIEACK